MGLQAAFFFFFLLHGGLPIALDEKQGEQKDEPIINEEIPWCELLFLYKPVRFLTSTQVCAMPVVISLHSHGKANAEFILKSVVKKSW